MTDSLPEILVRILEARGVSAADLDAFLHPSLKDLAKPSELPGIAAAAKHLLAAIRARRPVVVFGDYDCDGVCATTILTKTLAALGAPVKSFLPDRLTEGYGLSAASVERLLKTVPEVSLVVTVDNGINSVEPIATLKEKGIEVVVTDHHLPGEALPAAAVIVNPKVAAPATLEDICGAAVAFLLAGELVTQARAAGLYAGPSLAGPLLVLAGLATVTDVMPVLGQNRILVSEALARFRSLAPIGLRELLEHAARTTLTRLSSKDFGFLLGPRINAAGRLASAEDALALLLTTDREVAREKARLVDRHNAERREIERRMVEAAMEQVVPDAPAQVIDLPEGHPGVAGIVAARVMENLPIKVPVGVVVGAHGSARAPEGYQIREALAASSAVLDRFGGHALAAGFSVKAGQIAAFRACFGEACAAQRAQLPPSLQGLKADAWVEAGDLTLELAEAVTKLEPFGERNPEPVFGLRRVFLTEVRSLGAEGKHLSFVVRGLKAIWWNQGGRVESLRAQTGAVDVTFTLEISTYGSSHVELRIVDLEESRE